jgi:hypothetical protein
MKANKEEHSWWTDEEFSSPRALSRLYYYYQPNYKKLNFDARLFIYLLYRAISNDRLNRLQHLSRSSSVRHRRL